MVVSSPIQGAQVTSPFSLQAVDGQCDSQAVSAMGYSLDSSSNTTIVNAQSVAAMVTSATGSHVLHVKSWGDQGSACDTDIAIQVNAVAPTVPSNATAVTEIQALSSWVAQNDPATNGGAQGTTEVVSSPSTSGNAREFSMSFTSGGGELFHASFGADTAATNFVYDADVWLTSTSNLANVEMDMNQVMANGQTVIYGVQCDGYYGTWDYTINAGTPTSPVDQWEHSSLPCNPRQWSVNTWHHVQIAYSRDDSGNVTYQSVTLDGATSDFVNATGNSAFALGWGSTLLTNFQIDGLGQSGSNTAFLDNVTVYRW